ncbi:MAG: hypothetical protein V4732_15760 [Pseudomonadota bacterium]
MKKILFNFRHIFLMAFIATLCSAASNARAAVWTMLDGLDANVSANWSCWQSEASPANQCIYFRGRHFTGMTDVYILQGYSGWSDVGRPVSITPFRPWFFLPTLWCAAGMTVLPHQFANPDFQLEVIDSATWTYVRTKRVKFDPASISWPHRPVMVSTEAWAPTARNVFVRLGIIGAYTNGVLFIDGLQVTCVY